MGDTPLARSTDLIIEELGEETLVYDTKTDRGHSLSPAASQVWRSCDGKTSAEELSAKLGLDSDTADQALNELSANGLLEVSPTIVADGSTRREVTLKFAKVGATVAAAPLVLSVAAPLPAQAASPAFCARFSSRSCGCSQTGDGCCGARGCCCCVQPEPPPPGFKKCVPSDQQNLCASGDCSSVGEP